MVDSEPTFSIIIPTHKRPKELADCLTSIRKIDYPGHLFEVVVVDDGATVSEELIVSFAQDISVVWCRQKQAGPATTRNSGARLSKSEYLVFLDDDCLPAEDWLQNFAETLKINPNYLLGGKTVNALPSNIYSTASQLLVDFLYEYFLQNDSKNHFFTSNNIAISKANFQKLNGFDQSFPLPAAEDRDLCQRWRKIGGELQFVPAARILHAHNLNFRKFWRQHFNYGRGAFHFHKLRTLDENQKIGLEPISFYKKLLLYPFQNRGKRAGIRLLVLFLISQIATVSGFLYQNVTAEARLRKELLRKVAL